MGSSSSRAARGRSAFAAAGPVDGRVVRELGVLEEASGGPYVLSGVQALPGGKVMDGGRSLARERQYLERPSLRSLRVL